MGVEGRQRDGGGGEAQRETERQGERVCANVCVRVS